MRRKRNLFYILMALPGLLIVFSLFGYLIIDCFHMSFNQVKPMLHIYKYVGLKNYINAFKDEDFIQAIFRNVVYTVVVVIFSLLIGMIEALIVNKKFRGNAFIRIIFIAPMILIPAATGIIWIMLYNTDFGWINQFISFLGGTRFPFLGSKDLAFWSVIVTDIWGWAPFMFIILLAGLKSLPKEPFEAASIDGSSSVQTFRYITLPLLRPVVVIAVILKSVDTFRAFDYMWVMTQGGPGNASQILSTIIYRTGFRLYLYGYGSALSIIAMFISLIISVFMIIYYTRRGRTE